ncbi:hypothetical protein CROQUDRAFT_68423 [Cronartium quercuum f. sp. fusiforme G11]|uniref:Magnesium transporter n=1 Tax=Cronartium quercuum f. sp. fusiforme G11 TaxID=708437 RepID=A0A9P6NBP5_9BASI|nr:hypothetical protein CROQUDRAFT_68423 [Cronartium quercuum f. sp. fusiforme G11]
MGLLEDKYIGLGLAISSSLAIGTSFIITKKGLIDAADRTGSSTEGHTYLRNPIWWAGMATMVIGEVANFAAYTFAPPILVTPLGALSVLIGAVLASFFLKEELGRIGKIGCALCLVGSVIIVLHAPEDKEIETVDEILRYAMQPGFMIYCLFVLCFSLFMIYRIAPTYGPKQPIVYISICSLVGSVSVMAIKGFGVAIKLTFAGNNQLTHLPTYVFALVVVGCIIVQMNYFNKALDQFSTNVVNPIYYVCFSTATIVASLILFKGLGTQDAINTLSLIMGFVVTFLGVYLLNVSRYDPSGTSLNQINRRDGNISNQQTRISMSSERSLPLYHSSSINTNQHTTRGKYGRSEDSVLFEAFPEESVGLTIMHSEGSGSTTEDDDEEEENHHHHHHSIKKKNKNHDRLDHIITNDHIHTNSDSNPTTTLSSPPCHSPSSPTTRLDHSNTSTMPKSNSTPHSR